MTSAWRKAPIREIALGVFDGPHATPPPAAEGPIYLGIDHVTADGRLELSDVRHIAEKDYAAWTRRVVPQADDVVFSYEATLHRYARIPAGFVGCLGRRMALVRPDPSKVSPTFLHYAFLAPEWRMLMEKNTQHGSTVDRIPLTRFPDFELSLPELRAQRRIAAVLSAYDDLIENNAKRIRVLEEMARGLYREWFVNFRYPGHAGVGAESGLPARWELRSLVQCAKFLSGGTPSKARPDFWQGDIPWVSSGELTAMRVHETSLHVTSEGAENGSRIVPPETILCVVRGMSLAKEFRLGLTTKEMAFNQDLKAIVGEPDVDNLMLFHALDAQRDEIRKSANEAAHGTKKLDTPVLSKVQIVVPPAGLQRMFREHIVPIHDQWDNLTRRNTRLRAARDLLLPKLLSGQLSVDRIPDPAEAAG